MSAKDNILKAINAELEKMVFADLEFIYYLIKEMK